MSEPNLEAAVLKSNNGNLTKGLRQAQKTVCSILYSKGILSDDLHRKSTDTDDCMPSVMNALQERVEIDPKAYYILLDVLHETAGVQYLAERLEKDRKAMKEKNNEEKRKLMKDSKTGTEDEAEHPSKAHTRSCQDQEAVHEVDSIVSEGQMDIKNSTKKFQDQASLPQYGDLISPRL